MIKLKSLLVERIDYHDTAEYLVKHYKLRSKVSFGKVKGQNEADYDWVKDVINLKRNYPNVKEFIVSVLHEIHHATQVKKYGKKRFLKKYIQASNMADFDGFNRYDNNKWERKAENWANQEYRRFWKNKF